VVIAVVNRRRVCVNVKPPLLQDLLAHVLAAPGRDIVVGTPDPHGPPLDIAITTSGQADVTAAVRIVLSPKARRHRRPRSMRSPVIVSDLRTLLEVVESLAP
jgi:hypothetical protein